MQKDISAVKTIVFLQEEYGCYGTSLVTTTATVEEIKRWWAEGGFHPCSGKDSGHFTRSLPGTEVFPRESIVWKKDLVPLENGWHPVTWPKPGDVYHFVDRVEKGVKYYDSEEYVYDGSRSIFIHFHIGSDDVLCVGEEEIPHPHEEEWDRIMFGEE